MTYNWNIVEWIGQMIPVIYRKNPTTQYVIMLMKPLSHLHSVFFQLRLVLMKKMKFNGQVIILENMLNDDFDNALRRIRIITISDALRKTYIYQRVENKPLWIHTRNENLPVYIHLMDEYRNMSGFDFIVEVPNGVYSAIELERIKIATNYYRLAGKRAKFIYQDGTEF